MSLSAAPAAPEHPIALPSSISAAARAALAAALQRPAAPFPDHGDRAGWRARIAETDAWLHAMLDARLGAVRDGFESVATTLDGVAAFRIARRDAACTRVLFDIHGGGFTAGSGAVCALMGLASAAAFDALVYAVDYRMPPDHPYPAALDDCVAAYAALLAAHDPADVVVRGASAGGNLAAALMLRVRDAGLPLPAALILATPELDLTESGDSFRVNEAADVVLKGSLMPMNRLYADGHDLTDPLLSPLFGDFAPGFPPTLLTVGTRDLFLSNAARMHNLLRRAGNHSELIVEEAMPHGGFGGAPEDAALLADTVDFADRGWRGVLPRVAAQASAGRARPRWSRSVSPS